LIERNTTIPTSKKEIFSTAADNQTSVTIHILQGEREFAQDNRSLGRFDLTGIASAPRGMPQIEVEFALDANGILQVTATEKATGKSADIKINNSGGLPQDEIERMRKEAESNAAGDKAKRELVDTRNRAEQLIYATRKSLDEHGDKVAPNVRGDIESAISNLEQKIREDDKTAIEAAMKQLSDASMELGKIVYEQSAADAAGSEAGADGANRNSGSDGDEVIDAEYEVRDDR
jgi:molecular chaperone DnaK